ncbi:MAG: DNA polymerase I [Lactobacillales bacterium]|jgi:DNA polymerase-1|nr:DNA polymerase I [Lactobacillales bacterium]
MPRKTICLVDGSGYIFRAFYALPPMTRPDGVPINAVYGFTNMLMNLVTDHPCSHIVVVFDAKRKNFRNDIYAEYKQNRKETPPDLVPQFPLIRQATEAFSIPHIEMEGYEADDLIATYARIAEAKGFDVTVISADKDLMQLMRPHVTLYDPMKKKTVTIEDVEKKFGVIPDKVTDVQALMGDSSDNIPGANGIGPKGAADLIKQFGSLDNLIKNLNEVSSEKRREGLQRDLEQILVSKKLVALDDRAPVSDDLSQFEAKEHDPDKILAFLTDNGFKSMITKIPKWTQKRTSHLDAIQNNAPVSSKSTPFVPAPVAVKIPAFKKQTYTALLTPEDLKNALAKEKIGKKIAIDTETTSLDALDAILVGFSFSYETGDAYYVPLRHGGEEADLNAMDLFSAHTHKDRPKQIPVKQALEILKPVLQDADILKIGHNIKYDMHVLKKAYQNAVTIAPIADTMLISYTLDGTTHAHKLDDLAKMFLGYDMTPYSQVCGTGRNKITFDAVPIDAACFYAAEDADMTLRLYDVLINRLDNSDVAKVYYDIDLPMIPILQQMEQTGILTDTNHLQHLEVLFSDKLAQLTAQVHTLAGEEFNINSPAQLGVILFEKMNLPGGKKSANGNWSTDVSVLETLAGAHKNEFAKAVLEYRGFAKLKSTYVDALLAITQTDKRVHTSFSLTSTNTGRLASTDPNLQNIPIKNAEGKEIRRAFISKPGFVLMSADYSQIELRLMADVANVKLLKQAFIDKEDIHARTASEIFGIPLADVDADTRRSAKAINFGIIYGMSAFGLANNLGIERSKAKQYIDAYFEKYPEIKTYMQETSAFALAHEYVLTPFGRKCYIQGLKAGATRAFGLRSAINAPIQGGEADVVKMGMQAVIEVIKKHQLNAKLLLQVHDELVFEVAESDVENARRLIQNAMENVVKLSVPLTVDIGVGYNWKDAH